jgi:radical SAM superfamily enzyme YgiQ (UPF0313 family)
MVDDAFNLDLPRAKAIARLILRRGLKVHLSFPNGFRAEKVDAELLDLLKLAGCFRINYAVESASPRIQKMIGKGADLEKIRKAMEMSAARGIFTGSNFILGFPGETNEEMKKTVDFALHCRAHIASFFYLCPFPGTSLAKKHPTLAENLRVTHVQDYSQITVNLSAVSDREMTRICKQAYRRFYFSPTRMVRIIRTVPKNFRTLSNVLSIVFLSIKNAVNY